MGSVETVLVCHQLEEASDLFCEATLAPHSCAESWVVQFPPAQGLESAENFLATQRPMVQEPIVEEIAKAMGQAQYDVPGTAGTGGRGGFQDGGRLGVGQARNDRRNHDAGGNSCLRELLYRAEALMGRGGAGFERTL